MDNNAQKQVVDKSKAGHMGSVELVEFYASGHHAQYIMDIAHGFDLLGLDTSFLVSSDLESFLVGHRVHVISGCNKLLGLRWWRRHLAAKKLCNEAICVALSDNVSVMHFVYADWHLGAIASAWKKLKPSMRIVCTIHWTAGAGLGRGIQARLRGWIHLRGLKWLASHADIQVQVHHESIKHAISRYVSSERISVIPYPAHAPAHACSADCDRFRTMQGVSNDAVLLLCYGGMRYDKGADLAIKALALLPSRFHLLVAGNPGHFNAGSLQSIAETAGVSDRTHVLPRFLNEHETSQVFGASNILLLPYRKMFSGQSGPLMQAAALGKMVVVPSPSVLCETVRDFRLGECFDAENIESMAQAIERAERGSVLPEDTSHFRAQHGVDIFAEKVSRSYKSIILR